MRPIILLALALGVVLAGCAGDDEEATNDSMNDTTDRTPGGSSVRGNMTVNESSNTSAGNETSGSPP